MSIGDSVGKETLDKLNKETIPAIDKVVDEDIEELRRIGHEFLDRLNGATITLTINIPPRKPNPS